MKKERHNGVISIWKFIFCIVIVLYHAKPVFFNNTLPVFKSGYICVEFFFLVSGFYFAKHSLKGNYNKENIGKETIDFILRKLKILLPYTIIVVAATSLLFLKYNSSFNTNGLINSIWNSLLIKQFGYQGPLIDSPLWYLSVMLLSMFILYPLVRKYKENYIYLISPLIGILLLGYLSHIKISIDHSYETWIGIMYTGTIRGFAEINIGMFLYLINQKLKDVQYTIIAKALLTIISNGLMIMILFVALTINKSMYYDYVMLLMMIIAIQIMMSQKTYDTKILSNKYIEYLEKISLPIYINHSFFINIFKFVPKLASLDTSIKFTLFLSTTILLSIVEMELITFLKKRKWTSIKKIFIK